MGSKSLTTGDYVNQATASYLAKGLDALTDTILSESEEHVVAALYVDTLAIAFSSLSLFVIYFFVYSPLIAHLDLDIKRSRHLLLLIPDDIAKVVPAVVQAGQKLAVAQL